METNVLGQDDSALGAFNGEIQCESPNINLNKFDGTLIWKDNKFLASWSPSDVAVYKREREIIEFLVLFLRYSLDNDKILLRGCVLRNTPWCYGVVVFAGKDTKLMMNSGKTKFKRTRIDWLLNALILGVRSSFMMWRKKALRS